MATLPLFPLRAVLFPGAALPLRVFEPRYHAMLRDIGPRGAFGVVLIRRGEEAGAPAEPFAVGTSARIEALLDGGAQKFLQARGERRFRIVRLVPGAPYLRGEVDWLPEPDAREPEHGHPAGHGHAHLPVELEVAALLGDYLGLLGELTGVPVDEDLAALMAGRGGAGPWAMACAVGSVLLVPPEEKQPLLEAARVHDALHAEHALLERETARLRALARGLAAGRN